MRDLLLFEICVDVTLIYLCYGIKFLNSIEYTIPVRICLNHRIFYRTILRNFVIGMDKEMEMGEWEPGMKKRKLNYRFHNPNTAEATTAYLLKILLEANVAKVERAIREKSLDPEKEWHSA